MTMVGLSADCWDDRCDECIWPDNCTCACHDEEEDDGAA